MTTLLRRLASILAGLVLGFALVAVIATQVFGYRVAAIASDSMRPTLAPGDLVIARPVPIGDIAHDDIVLFETGETTKILVAHRVANIVTVNMNITDSATGQTRTERTQILRTKGDGNATIDEQPVDDVAYRGLVFVTVPGIGNLLASPLPFAGLAVVIGVAWLLLEVATRIRGSRQTAADRPGGGS
jgi:signal peptidase